MRSEGRGGSVERLCPSASPAMMAASSSRSRRRRTGSGRVMLVRGTTGTTPSSWRTSTARGTPRMCVWLPFFLKTEDMGWILGKKLGTVIAVSHRNHKIVDEHLRIRIEHAVDKPLRKYVDTTPAGSSNKINYDVKYEKLPNFCFCCELLGHTTETFCSIPREMRKASFSTDSGAPPFWSSVRRHIDFGGMPLPEGVIKEVANTVKQLTVSDGTEQNEKTAMEMVASAGAGVDGALATAAASTQDDEGLGSQNLGKGDGGAPNSNMGASVTLESEAVKANCCHGSSRAGPGLDINMDGPASDDGQDGCGCCAAAAGCSKLAAGQAGPVCLAPAAAASNLAGAAVPSTTSRVLLCPAHLRLLLLLAALLRL